VIAVLFFRVARSMVGKKRDGSILLQALLRTDWYSGAKSI